MEFLKVAERENWVDEAQRGERGVIYKGDVGTSTSSEAASMESLHGQKLVRR